MTFKKPNEAKASFDDVYTSPTPHAYVAAMASCGYEIGEQSRPYLTGAAELVRERNGEAWPVQMLDIGCSYGIGAAFVKYGVTFDEMVAFFASRAPTEYGATCEATRVWLNVTPPACDVRCVGLDTAEPAVRFALAAGLLDGGIVKDLEQPNVTPDDTDRAWFRSCNLLISTGAIGYVSERTLDAVLRDLGRDNPTPFGPVAVMTILRMFDDEPIRAAFARHGFRFAPVPDVRMPQRRFVDEVERRRVLTALRGRGVDPAEWEERGKLYADLYIAARQDDYAALMERMTDVHSRGGRAGHFIRR